MGTERLRFLRGGSVVRPHVMPFNLEWMKKINQKYIPKLPKAFTLYFTDFTSLYLKGFACSVLTEIFKTELVLLTLLTASLARWAQSACCVLTENLRGKI